MKTQSQKSAVAKNKDSQKTPSAYIVHKNIKPVVVKHILKDQIANIQDPRIFSQGGYQPKESVRFSEASLSPRFYGQGQPPYFGRPEEVSRELIQNLEKGMSQLVSTYQKKENIDPAREAMQRREFDQFEVRSMQSEALYDHMHEAMTMEELDRLKVENQDRIKKIEQQYFQKKEEFKPIIEVVKEKNDKRDIKTKQYDSSLSYPTYGRGVDPNPDIDTYMINSSLYQEGVGIGSPKKKGKHHNKEGGGIDELDNDEDGQKRPKIISPRRQKYENQFEKFMVHKYVEDAIKVEEQPIKDLKQFDTVTKLTDSLNALVQKKMRDRDEKAKQKKNAKKVAKSLVEIEENLEKKLTDEATVNLGQEVVDKLRTIFESLIEDPDSEEIYIDLNTLVGTIAEENFFQDMMEQVVRESLDGEKEILEDLLNRILTEFKESEISWLQFLGFFSKRGRLQTLKELTISPTKSRRAGAQDEQDAEQGGNTQYEKEVKKQVKLKQVKETLKYKQEKIPKEGKGKYNLTIPAPYEFLKNEKKEKSIRQRKLEEMLQEKEDKFKELKQVVFRANPIPRTTTEPLYQKIMQSNEERRQEVRRNSLALTMQNEKPFSFYLRDKEKQKGGVLSEIPETMRNPPFRANKIPWKVLVPLYKRMVDKIEYEREQRIKKNAEVSYSLAKLPPRMEAYEKQRKLQELEGQMKSSRSMSLDMYCTFQPPRAKPVPDFKRLQKQFQSTLESKKKSHKQTIPNGFTFHLPKSTARLRRYLDQENQMINPTIRHEQKRMARSLSVKESHHEGGERDIKENPATTLKFVSYVEKRRKEMEDKKQNEEIKFQEEVERFIKQNRLSQRVRCSPAIVNNAMELKKRKEMSISRAKDNMKKQERDYEAQKAQIEFNVANKPLLVEQVSKAFIHNLNAIRELQRYVNILREANLNPDEHLTEEQKELLLSAEYYDRLNAATAYFPSNMALNQDVGDEDGHNDGGEGEGENEGEEMDRGEEEVENDGQQHNMGGQEPIEENQQEEDQEEDEEGHGEEQEEGEMDEGEGEDDGDELVHYDEEQLKQLLAYQQQHQMLMAHEMHEGMGEEDEDDGQMDDDQQDEDDDQ